ncbi:unnamed protein product [Blepharisma stoltei]|uniref:Uncharacterized protein n=1 Tax=Blepharisma stoltei TaxID=1481888 RepID=A0AAU9JSL5_9CILI|nr:unnamed protein product [Blepharisma stoltei]
MNEPKNLHSSIVKKEHSSVSNLESLGRLHSPASRKHNTSKSSKNFRSMHTKKLSVPIISTYQINDDKLSLKIDTHVIKTPPNIDLKKSSSWKEGIRTKVTPKFHFNLQTGNCFELQAVENRIEAAKNKTFGKFQERNYQMQHFNK